MTPTMDVVPKNDANRLGLVYPVEAARLPWRGAIWDVHTHLADIEAARLFFEVADLFGIEKVWSMTYLEEVDAIQEEFGDRVEFIAIPRYDRMDEPDTFTTDWLKRIELHAEKGARMCKFWAAPRGIDFDRDLTLDSPIRREGMRLARSLGMQFMTHVGDPDTWFATHYRDHHRYGTKVQHYQALERLLEEFHDVRWIAAHMGGDPEHLDHLQSLLDRYPHLYLDCSATKWMVRELSRQPYEFRSFCRRNAGRVLFGSDNVADSQTMTFDLLASRYWALRALIETDYDGPSPIVDPDLSLVDPGQPRESTARIRGAMFGSAELSSLYRGAAERFFADGIK